MATHEIFNQTPPLADYDMFGNDAVLVEAVTRHGAGWALEELAEFGRLTGSAALMEHGRLATLLVVEDARGLVADNEADALAARGRRAREGHDRAPHEAAVQRRRVREHRGHAGAHLPLEEWRKETKI